MADISKLCPGCMREKPDFTAECPYCKFDASTENEEGALPLGTTLSERYIVGRVLSVNGEGISYIGFDKQNDQAVRIREYCPQGLCERINTLVRSFSESQPIFTAQMRNFLELARSLARMRGLTALLPVYDIFEANGTAYYISETVESITLRDFLIRNGGSLNFEQLRPMIMPIMSTLSSLHAVDIIHRGISPDTLIIGKDGKLRLTEFCVADARTARTDMSAQLFKGYAAIEQYGFDGEQGAWTDVYALAACIYRALVGSPPPEATSRVTNDKLIIPAAVADNLSAYVMSGLANAMQILPADRTRSIEQFRDEISATPTVVSRAANHRNDEPVDAPAATPERTKKKGSGLKYALISIAITLVALAGVAALVYFGLFGGGSSTEVVETTAPTTTAAPTNSTVILDPTIGTTPSLLGMTYADMMSSTDADIIKAVKNYDIVISSKEYSNDEKGTILSQEPAAGSKIKKGDKITIKVSLGSQKFAMPSIIGLERNEAYIALLEAGFEAENVKWDSKYSTSSAPGTVVDVTPSAGETVSGDVYVTVYMNSYTTTAPAETTLEEWTFTEQ